MLGNNSGNEMTFLIKQFDIFGVLIDSPESISSLKKLVLKLKTSIVTSSQFYFPIWKTMHLGISSFFTELISQRF
jgi:hypothetical protein